MLIHLLLVVAQLIHQQVVVEVLDLGIVKHQGVQEVEHQTHQELKVQETQEVFLHLKEIQEDLEQEQVVIMDQQVVVDMVQLEVVDQIQQVVQVVQEQIFLQVFQVYLIQEF